MKLRAIHAIRKQHNRVAPLLTMVMHQSVVNTLDRQFPPTSDAAGELTRLPRGSPSVCRKHVREACFDSNRATLLILPTATA